MYIPHFYLGYSGHPLYMKFCRIIDYLHTYAIDMDHNIKGMCNDLREKFETTYKATGKRFDVGKSCVRFKKLDDLPLDLIGKTISSLEADELIRIMEEVQSARKIKKSKA